MTTKEFNFLLQNIKVEDNFKKLYLECLPQIIKYSNYIFMGQKLGRDIAQDIFTYLLSCTSMPYVRHTRAWLYALCKSHGLKYVSNNTVLEDDAPYVSIVDKYDNIDLEFLIKQLDAEEREIVELKYISGFSLKEIAIIKNRAYSAVLKQHFRILRKLEKKLSKKT